MQNRHRCDGRRAFHRSRSGSRHHCHQGSAEPCGCEARTGRRGLYGLRASGRSGPECGQTGCHPCRHSGRGSRHHRKRSVRLRPALREPGRKADRQRRCGHHCCRRHGKHVPRALPGTAGPLRLPHGQRSPGGCSVKGCAYRRILRLPHGNDRRKYLRPVGTDPRAAGRVRCQQPAEMRKGHE